MTVQDSGGTEYDPFGNDVQQAQLIVSMKIYDVMMALLQHTAPDVAEDLDRMHSEGVILGLGPQFNHFHQREDETAPQSVQE